MYDAIVIGGGIVGISTAYHLTNAGLRVLLIDRRDEGRATDAGAGILSAETYSGSNDTWFRFALEASHYYTLLLRELEEQGAGETGFARCGQLSVAISADELEAFEEATKTILARQQQRGLPLSENLVEISPAEAVTLCPPLGSVRRALYYRRAARVDGRLLTRTLSRAARRLGLTTETASVDHLLMDGKRVCGVVKGDHIIDARKIILAGGAWSGIIATQLGTHLPVAPQRGQIVHLSVKSTETHEWPLVTTFRDHYMVPWPQGRVVAGATWENDSGFDAESTASGVRLLLEEALRIAPGLAHAAVQEIRVGLRPRSPDGLPILGPVPGLEGIFVATGHGGTGLATGPFSGKIIADLAMEREIPYDIQPFSMARFGEF